MHLHKTRAFKTIQARLAFHADLDEHAAARGLVPRVLARGTKRYPDLRSLQSALDGFFAAHLSGHARKMGERQLVVFRGEWITDRLAGTRLLDEMGRMWAELLHEPAMTAEGRLRPEVIEQERKIQADDADAVIDDKGRYARHRLIQEMCAGEAFARPALGTADEIRALTPDSVEAAYRGLLERAPADLFLVGDLTWAAALKFARGLSLHRGRVPRQLKKTRKAKATRVRTVKEQQEVGQAKLELGFRVAIGYGHSLYSGLVYMNVLFGGSPIGKLFKKVREEASLCYSVHSGVERTKGLLIVQAGIDSANYAKARRLILKQLKELQAGRITDEEFGRARSILLSSVRSLSDSPGGLIEFGLERLVNGVPADLEATLEDLANVSVTNVRQAAKRVTLDTVYLLSD